MSQIVQDIILTKFNSVQSITIKCICVLSTELKIMEDIRKIYDRDSVLKKCTV